MRDCQLIISIHVLAYGTKYSTFTNYFVDLEQGPVRKEKTGIKMSKPHVGIQGIDEKMGARDDASIVVPVGSKEKYLM